MIGSNISGNGEASRSAVTSQSETAKLLGILNITQNAATEHYISRLSGLAEGDVKRCAERLIKGGYLVRKEGSVGPSLYANTPKANVLLVICSDYRLNGQHIDELRKRSDNSSNPFPDELTQGLLYDLRKKGIVKNMTPTGLGRKIFNHVKDLYQDMPEEMAVPKAG